MNISNFLIIDAALAIVVIPILFLHKGDKRKAAISKSSNKKELLRKTTIKLPEKEKLIKLEKHAKNQGSGIEFDSLLGAWKFVSVWKKGIDKENHVFSLLLRFFSAKIEFKKDISTVDLPRFSVISSIRFGLFSIEFSGYGYLKGEQPLLAYVLNLIEVKSGSNILLRKCLEEPNQNSFFALVALEEKGEWLSARGHGGAFVIWLKD